MNMKDIVKSSIYNLWKFTDGPRTIAADAARSVCEYLYGNDGYMTRKATCGRVWKETFDYSYYIVGLAGLITSGTLGYISREARKSIQEFSYDKYLKKDDAQISDISKDKLLTFNRGAKAQASWLSYFSSFRKYNNYKYIRDFNAGFAARRHNNNELINNVVSKLN